MSDDFELAADLVRRAGELADGLRLAGLSVAEKTSISDVVSNADSAAEAYIVSRLAEVRPDDGLIGEEGSVAPGRRTWVIDPVDGTYNFVSGLPAWCSALALTDGDELVLGAVFQPATDELWLGGSGSPTTLNGLEVPALVDRPLAEISIATYLHPPRMADANLREPLWRAISGAAALRMIGSGSVELAAVAGGRLGLWSSVDTHDWDWFPGAALVQAAGGVTDVFEHRGRRFHIAGPPTAVSDARELVLSA